MKYKIDYTKNFKKQYKRIKKQGKDLDKFFAVVTTLAMGEELNVKYKNHNLINDKIYKDCCECHIEPDWLLIYQIKDNELILLLFAIGSHSELFKK